MNHLEISQKAEDIIFNHVCFAAGVGVVPIPLVDIIGVTAVQIDMLKQLAKVYGIPFREEAGKSYMSAISGGVFARIGASAIKTIPIFGSYLGGVSMFVLSGASTFAIGQVFKEHFEEGGDFSNMDVEKAKNLYKEELEKGKKVTKNIKDNQEEKKVKQDLEDNQEEKKPSSLDAIIAQIEKLGALHAKGYLSKDEFEAQKKRLLDSIPLND